MKNNINKMSQEELEMVTGSTGLQSMMLLTCMANIGVKDIPDAYLLGKGKGKCGPSTYSAATSYLNTKLKQFGVNGYLDDGMKTDNFYYINGTPSNATEVLTHIKKKLSAKKVIEYDC